MTFIATAATPDAGTPSDAVDLQRDRRVAGHRLRRRNMRLSALRVGVRHRTERSVAEVRWRCPGEVSRDVRDQLDGAGRSVLEVHLAVRTDRGDDEVRDGLAGREVQVRGGGERRPVRVDGDVAVRARLCDRHVEHDGRDPGRRHAPSPCDAERHGPLGRDGGLGCPRTVAGVEQASRGDGGEGAVGGRASAAEVARDVRDELDRAGRSVGEVHLAVRTDRGDDEVGDGLARREVQVRGGGERRPVRVDGDVALRARAVRPSR